MSSSARCDSIFNEIVLELHLLCPNSNCECEKQISFTPTLFELELGSKKRKLEKLTGMKKLRLDFSS